MGRRPCCAKEGLNRGAWSVREDEILTNYIKIHGEGKWRDLPQRAGLQRCGKSCRLRWLNYLRPDIKRGNISTEEDELIIRLHKLLGNRWSLIAGRLPGRTDNEIKNYWNTNLSKRVHGQNSTPNTTQSKPKCVKSSPEPELRHKVIRTKAVKCTKAVVNIINNLDLGPNSYENNSTTTTASDTPSSNSANIHEDNNLIDDNFLMDFDINELMISDFHDQILQVDHHGINGDDEYGHGFNLFHQEDELYMSSVDETVSDHNVGASNSNFFQTTETFSLDLRSLASYLNLED